jgi:hypothetical protein
MMRSVGQTVECSTDETNIYHVLYQRGNRTVILRDSMFQEIILVASKCKFLSRMKIVI